jgi:hypothetical protein
MSHYVVWNYTFSTELADISETIPATAELSPLPFVIIKIITGHTPTMQALPATSTESLVNTTLHTSYENTINLTCTLHSSEDLTHWFMALLTKTEDLTLEHDSTIANHNMLTTEVMQLETQLTKTLTLPTTTANSSPAGHNGQTYP